MITLRTEAKLGSGMIGALIGLVFIAVSLMAAAKLAETIILTQRLDALAADSVRRLTVASGSANPNTQNELEKRIEDLLPSYKNNLSFSLSQSSNLLTFRIQLNDYSVFIWPGLNAGPYTLSAAATARLEA